MTSTRPGRSPSSDTVTFLGMPTPADPLRWGPSFPDAARRDLGNEQLRRNLGHATSTIRAKRARVVDEVPDWEALRDAGSALKTQVMDNLPELLEELERNVVARGGVVHWARDAAEANRIVADVIKAKGSAHDGGHASGTPEDPPVTEVVKVKSMATQEIGLNEALEAEGIHATETDLAELIVQLADDMPSHILVPAIHRNRAEIREIFAARMGDAPSDLSDVPRELAMAARAHLRRKFLSAKVAVSGANFGVAETGTLSVVESEGNGRMCLTLPETLITVMGIEKLIPRFTDLEVFLQLLPRSSTGERMNPYTSMWTGVTPGDGPSEFHLVLLDNGRTKVLADEVGRSALHCIRCSACLNVCPVYERVGGHAYGSVYPGPIGAILTPQLTGEPSDLPYASTLCGACYDVCPVKIDIPSILVDLRAREVESGSAGKGWGAAMRAASTVMSDGGRFGRVERLARVGRVLGGKDGVISRLPGPGAAWTDSRDLPVPPKRTFRDWWADRERERENHTGGADHAAHAAPDGATEQAETEQAENETEDR